MNRIDEMPDHRARLPHSMHDLSHTFGFTATAAHLLPVFHTLIDAGDSINIGIDFNLRTQPLAAAAMEDIDVNIEYFFVPMFLLYQPFGSIYYQIRDEHSSMFDPDSLTSMGEKFPVLDLQSIYEEIRDNQGYSEYVAGDQCESWGQMIYRLLDHLHFNVNETMFAEAGTCWNPSVFPYQLLAYQCIYQYFYRLDTREQFDHNVFNWDRFYATSTVGSTELGDDLMSLLTLHYRPMKSDYFTDVKVSPIVDVLNLNQKTLLPVVNDWLTRSNLVNSVSNTVPVLSSGYTGNSEVGSVGSPTYPGYTPSSVIQTNFGFRYSISDSQPNNGTDINTANIRALFANEKLWSITGRAKKHYDDQTLAHFGYKVPHDPKHELTYLGKDLTQIHIGEVISTAATDSADLGTIAGKGYARLQSKKHKFTAPCHGVVMAIMSITPNLRYASTFGKENVVTKRTDLPIPEYDHLGMQPLFNYEVDPNDDSNRTNVISWQYRYEQFKRRYNRVSQAFANSGSLHSWMLGIEAHPYHHLETPNSESFIDYVYKPDVLNQIFLGQYSMLWSSDFLTSASSIYDYDPFVVDCFIDCKLNSWMSDYSLPRLDA